MKTPPAAAALLLALSACRQAGPPAAASQTRQTLEDFSLSQDWNGRTAWILRARFALLNEQNQEVSLSAPRMEFFEKAAPASRVSALQGTADISTKDIVLSSSVVLTSIAEKSMLKTELLSFSNARRKFHTDADVELTRPSGVLYGKGLEADPDLSEVRIFKQRAKVKL